MDFGGQGATLFITAPRKDHEWKDYEGTLREHQKPLPRKDSEWKDERGGNDPDHLLRLLTASNLKTSTGDLRLSIGESVHVAGRLDYRGP